MIKILLISFLFVGITPNVEYIYKNNTNKIVYYIKYKKLTWNDFTVINKKQLDVSESVTQINMDIDYKNNKVSKIFVSCLLLKDKSWVLSNQKNDYILNHEQRHFDITYIYSNKLIQLINGVTDIEQVNKIYDNCIYNMNLMQVNYDNETNHSINKEKQKEWDNKIDILNK